MISRLVNCSNLKDEGESAIRSNTDQTNQVREKYHRGLYTSGKAGDREDSVERPEDFCRGKEVERIENERKCLVEKKGGDWIKEEAVKGKGIWKRGEADKGESIFRNGEVDKKEGIFRREEINRGEGIWRRGKVEKGEGIWRRGEVDKEEDICRIGEVDRGEGNWRKRKVVKEEDIWRRGEVVKEEDLCRIGKVDQGDCNWRKREEDQGEGNWRRKEEVKEEDIWKRGEVVKEEDILRRGSIENGKSDWRSTQQLNINFTCDEKFPVRRQNKDTFGKDQSKSIKSSKGQGHQNPNRKSNCKPDLLTFEKLQSYENKDSSAILLSLGHEKSGLYELLNQIEYNPDMITLIILSVIAKGCSSNSAPQNKMSILTKLCNSKFFSTEIPKLLLQISNSSSESDQRLKKTLNDISEIILALFLNIPAACANMSLVGVTSVLEPVIDELKGNSLVIDEDLLETFTKIKALKEKRLNKIKVKGMTDKQKDTYFDEVLPPDDFRRISILPNTEDLDPNAAPFLRKNKIDGGYSNTNDYLDVQFRLLREDFIQPLRNGVNEYQNMIQENSSGQHQITDVQIYTGVSIIRSVCARNDLLYRLQFDISRFKRFNWKRSKRLIYGSLVCLSADNFYTIYNATVSDRDEDLLQNGMIDVKFEHDLQEIDAIPEGQNFIMVETTAFFEAYRHVLKGLQDIQELPFENYLVQSQPAVSSPKYLHHGTQFDLRPLVDANMKLREDDETRPVVYSFSPKSKPAENVTVLDESSWPRHELLHLDKSQFSALHTALSKEFSIIQGPPGTGKTYVGFKIVKALLHNSHTWNSPTIDGDTRPMLIVCYTNHALDQFMAGIVSFYKGKVIRIGGRISNPEMEKYSLRHWRQTMMEDEFKDLTIIHDTNCRDAWELCEKIETTGQRIDAAKSNILKEYILRPFMSRKHMKQLSKSCYKQQLYEMGYNVSKIESIMTEWLGITVNGIIRENLTGEIRHNEAEAQTDERVIDVDDEGSIMTSKRLLDTDEKEHKNKFKEKINKMCQSLRNEEIAFDMTNLNSSKNDPNDTFKKLKKQIKQKLTLITKLSKEEADTITDIWQIDINTRWRLYQYWISLHCQRLKNTVTELNEEYRTKCVAIREVECQKDKLIMSKMTIIAMTTTGAARYQNILQEINPRIIIVEEAAEVLEGHIITSLTQGCEQLILIGDHKQLRPNPTVYQLATKYNLQVSLFERLLNNGFHYDCLEIQHRMRPEISRLLKPIYPKLQDHESVKSFDNVMGLSTNIFFIDHKFEEEQHGEEITSHSNQYEAEYLCRFTDYLLKQGYKPSQITILTTYSGQLFQLQKLMPKKNFDGLRITSVDNFQGEENDIIRIFHWFAVTHKKILAF